MPIYSMDFVVISDNGRISRNKKNRLKRILLEFPNHRRFSISHYLFFSDMNIEQINDIVAEILDEKDKILITEFSGNHCGSISDEDWQWIDEFLHKKNLKVIKRNRIKKFNASLIE